MKIPEINKLIPLQDAEKLAAIILGAFMEAKEQTEYNNLCNSEKTSNLHLQIKSHENEKS